MLLWQVFKIVFNELRCSKNLKFKFFEEPKINKKIFRNHLKHSEGISFQGIHTIRVIDMVITLC